MAIIQLPPAPAGQTYVNKVTASGAVTVLVPTSSLSEDICEATGRTWAEEARLYNINNAPDGKLIAEPGDQFYQTAESMKNRNKQIGTISAASLTIYNQFVSEKPVAVPNLNETMNKIKDGSINADITAGLNNISSVSASLPGFLTAGLNAAKEAAAEQMAELQSQLPKLQAIAATNVDILTKQAIAATGKPPTEAQIKQASGALAIFQDAPAALRTQAENLAKSIGSAAGAFGGPSSKLSAALTSFTASIPEATIPNPVPGGAPIPNPAFTAFSAIPANAQKLTGLTGLAGSLTAAAGNLTSQFGALVESQGLAVDSSTSNIKAFGFAASLAKKVVGLAAAANDAALNPAAFNADSISQTFGQAVRLGPALDTSLYKNTKDDDLTYTGDDGLVWDRVNTERLRRNLAGLTNKRPDDPPPVDRGTTPPKESSAPKPGITVQDPDETNAAPATPTKIVFEKPPNEKISKRFVLIYETVKDNFDKYSDTQKEIVEFDRYKKEYFGSAVDYLALVDEVKKISKSKNGSKDKKDYTDAENLKFKQYKFYLTAWKQSKEWGEYVWSIDAFNFCAEQYNILYDAWQAGKTYKDLPLSLEEPINSPERTIGNWEKIFGKDFFTTFQDWQKANPSLSFPTEL
jgi:hypothetical protein